MFRYMNLMLYNGVKDFIEEIYNEVEYTQGIREIIFKGKRLFIVIMMELGFYASVKGASFKNIEFK